MFGHHQDVQEEAKLEVMQRVWQGKRNSSSSTAFFEGVNETEDILAVPRQNSWVTICVPPPQKSTCSDVESDNELFETPELLAVSKEPGRYEPAFQKLDAASLGDLPAHYVICPVQPHQMPVCGVYVDRRIVAGFKYKVRPLPPVGQRSTTNKCMFGERALTLQSIGRGFARRFTFEADKGQINSNDNYFYSDNRPEGYAFELEVISEGDKFTIFDIGREAQGTVEVLKVEGPQFEISSSLTKQGLEKRANVKFIGKVEFYDTGVAKPMILNGVVVALKPKGKGRAEVTKVINVTIKNQRWYLTPGIQNNYRRITVKGQDINDVPTKYTMTGMEPYEIPVVGTYVDPRIVPGFSYRVRPNNRNKHLFNGRALRLVSIGMGYAKRLTFEPDSQLNADNYLWSDNHPDGLGLEPRAVHKGMKFMVKAGEQVLGEATVFRDDKPQFEEKTEKVEVSPGQYAIVKHIHIDVICHIQLIRPGGGSSEEDCYLMRVSGVAIVRKQPKTNVARVREVYNIGLDSQLNILFAQTHTEIKFIPK
ncbi:uncharacterized protein LOC115882563 [Sitophilus oryzae]|uniref:Uncharacterized protein LOC115882563 n=1 Tax=Sitophilus oryzae TaxID=7048 RepID=A0A6J2Y0N6_SITOR|nr:uncharacterized protein LOC115882563 [Sitophilus oryzae]XP_030756596.1 uncharacterized protein LOC115882563 [Sitophilus oryzae]